ncbi:MAG: type VI secretion system baseplate subunit TssG, partial [Planctomycetes bacterium]|nr:type VI secretion system baseplate subunit TssG [Planctomycetota bacterium]
MIRNFVKDEVAVGKKSSTPELPLQRQMFEPETICSFDFFQSVRLLRFLGMKDRVAVGEDGPPLREEARFLAHRSLAFPASAIQQLEADSGARPPRMTVNFMGLTGPNGVLPRHYTERLWTDDKKPEHAALQDWFDLFNHRLISLFYRAWEKYRFYLAYERGESRRRDPDLFTLSLFSLMGLGLGSHRNRFRVTFLEIHQPLERSETGTSLLEPAGHERELAKLDDLALLRFSGLFAHRPRCAVSLEQFLQIYLQMHVKVVQFQGQWLHLNRESQTAMGAVNNRLGADTLVGDRIWDIQSKVRIRLGPLNYAQFLEFLPDRTPGNKRKRIFLLAQLVRYYLGAEIDVEFQLLLRKEEVPAAQTGPHIRLGWN